MKKILLLTKPISIAALSLLIVSSFLRYYLYVNSSQMVHEFKNQNYKEIYSLDTLKIASRLNSLSMAINWVCIEGSVNEKTFFKIQKGQCSTGLFQQKTSLNLPQADNLKILFTIKLPKEVEYLFIIFIIFQSLLIFALIKVTKKSEQDKRLNEIKINKLARQMSHDIRSPLATLNTVIDEIITLDESSKHLLKNSLLRINEISNKHLINSKENSLCLNIPKYEIIDLNDFLFKLIEFKRLELKSKDIIINFNPHTINCFSKIDQVEFDRIISNLINNSFEANATLVEISLNNDNKSNIIILIKDNGQGISDEILLRLGSGEISTKRKGNGLGIIHAKESIESWNGVFLINSKINIFTEVSIILPSTNLAKMHKPEMIDILIDNDELVRLTWEFKANKKGINFKSFPSYESFKLLLHTLSKDSNIYLDSELGNNIKGEVIAQELNLLGFSNIYMATGSDEVHFKNFTFLKGVRDKAPPW